MPPPWAAGAKLRIVGKIHSQDCIQVMHLATNTVVNDDATGIALLKALADAMAQCVVDTLLPAVTSDYQFHHVEVTSIHPFKSDPIISDLVGPTAGQLGAQGVGFAAQLADLRTGGGGKSGRGRNFYPPASEAVATAGAWDGAQLLLLAEFLACVGAKFLGAAPSTPWRLGVFSRKKVGDPPVNQTFDNAFREGRSYTAVNTIAVMGTRKLNRGS